jgi:anaerobic selenocysteine-containing dehydrogenase
MLFRSTPYIFQRKSRRGLGLPLDILPSVCPHDCPSACALEVERIDGRRIGRVRGARSQSYTAGVVCAKVARYAERQHHPDRLSQPLRRIGEKGVGRAAFAPVSWDEALDAVAEALTGAARRYGPEAVWPYYYAGTMGLVQRDGINRLRHAMRYSREDLSICNMASDAGWLAGVGVKRGVDGREIAKSDLIVIWGGNPVSTQVNVMAHAATARRERGAKLVVIDPIGLRPQLRPICTSPSCPAPTAPSPAPSCTSCSARAMPTAPIWRAILTTPRGSKRIS